MLTVKNFLEEKVIVIADDLTGANEIASIMVRRGKKSLVSNGFLGNNEIRKLWNIYEGLVFDLNSRNLPEEKAYNRIKDFLTSLEEIKKGLIYKKIDSTLRGNVGKEIDAVLDTGCADIVVLVPALPFMERITVGGYHLVQGVPVGRTSYAKNFTGSYLPEFLRGQSICQIGYVGLRTVELGPDVISQRLIREYEKGSSIIVCDCCSQDDLENIKQAILSVKLKVLPVGSAGLFEELLHEDEPRSLPCLIVCGSLNQITRLQLTKLISEERCGCLELDLSSSLSPEEEDKLKRLLVEGESILNQGKSLVVATSENCWEIGKRQKDDIMRSKINQSLAHLAKYFIKNFSFAGVIAIGGDTARALLDSLQAHGIEAIDELEPLVPVGIIRGGEGKGMLIITKTGGFGGEDVFLKAVSYLGKRGRKIER